MNKTVVIDCDEQGNYSVGEEPHESGQEAQAEAGGGEGGPQDQGEGQMQMQPAKSLDDALQMARAIFAGGQEDSGQTDAAMQQGFQNVAGSPPMGMA